MKIRNRATALLLLAVILAVGAGPADAQFRKLKERAMKAVEDGIDRTTDKVVDNAVDQASDRAAAEINNEVNAALKAEASEAATSGDVGEGLGALSQSLNELGKAYGVNSNVDPIDFRELKALLPDGFSGLTKGEATGQKGGAMGIMTSSAEADYTSGDRTVRVSIGDMGTLTGATMFGYAWLATQIDVENDHGYERTTRIGDFPGYEKFEAYDDYTRAELTVVVGERFVVGLTGDNVDMDVLKAGLEKIDVAKLASMKEIGVTPDPEAEAKQAEAEAALNDLTKAYAATPASAIEPVEFRVLKDLLPAQVAGLARTNASGQKGAAFGMRMSSAEGTYGEGEQQVRVTLTDMGTLTDLARLSYAWLAMEVEQEDDHGYERTFTYEGYPAFMHYRHDGDYRSSEIQVVVKDRFIVAIDGEGIDMDAAEAALKAIDLSAIAGL